MIHDRIENAARYAAIPSLADAIRLLLNTDFPALAAGAYPAADGLRFLVQRYTTKRASEARLEGHTRHIDVQYMLEGEEYIACRQKTAEDQAEEFDPVRDVGFYAGGGDPIRLGQGEFMVLFPQDLHAPCISVGEPAPVSKVVIKIRLLRTEAE